MKRSRITRPGSSRQPEFFDGRKTRVSTSTPRDPAVVPIGTTTNSEPLDDVTQLARRFRRESIATLISVSRNERAPASARASAAAKILEYADGRPQQAKAITVADLDNLSADERIALWTALYEKFEQDQPGMIREIFEEAGLAALREREIRSTRYLEGMPQPAPSRRQRLQSVAEPEDEELTASTGVECTENRPTAPISITSPAGETANSHSWESTENDHDNVLPLPRGTHPVIHGSLDNPPASGAAANGLDPNVLTRSTRLNGHGLAMDRTFADYKPRWR